MAVVSVGAVAGRATVVAVLVVVASMFRWFSAGTAVAYGVVAGGVVKAAVGGGGLGCGWGGSNVPMRGSSCGSWLGCGWDGGTAVAGAAAGAATEVAAAVPMAPAVGVIFFRCKIFVLGALQFKKSAQI